MAASLPRYGRVVYCLYRDPRTPRWWKVGLGLALGVIWTPFINIPEAVPVLGQMEWVALTLLAIRLAIGRAPQDLVGEHEAAIARGDSLWHQDMARARDTALEYRARRRLN
jgi:uncharacterized membrane protein YkvA (DUF1232 family)